MWSQKRGEERLFAGSHVAQVETQVQAQGNQAGIGNVLPKVMDVPVAIQNATLLQGVNPERQPAPSQPTPPQVTQMHSYGATPQAHKTAFITTPRTQANVAVPRAKTKVVIRTANLRNLSAPSPEVRKVITQPVQDLVTNRNIARIVLVDCSDSVAAREEDELMEELKAIPESPPSSPEPYVPTYDDNVRPVFTKVCALLHLIRDDWKVLLRTEVLL